MSGKSIIEAAKEAVAVAKGERPAARIHVNGHAYVPEALEFRPPIPEAVWAEMVERGARTIAATHEECGSGCWCSWLCACRMDATACLRAALGLDERAAAARADTEEP